MKNFKTIGIIAAAITILGAGIASAADLDYDDYRNDKYNDHSYIDKTIDNFEQRNGISKYSNQKGNKWNKGNWNKNAWKNDKWRDRGNYCMHPRRIRRRLSKRGWHDFEMLRDGPRRIRMLARNYNGRKFRLVVDKCDGNIVRRQPVRRHFGWGRRY